MEYPVCAPLRLSCLARATQDYYAAEKFESCNCPFECDVVRYDILSSMNKFSRTFLQDTGKMHNVTPNEVAENFVVIDIYFSSMIRFDTVEKEGYTWLALLSDVGGAFGLALGATILTVFELIDGVVLIISRFLENKKARKIEINQ